MDGKVFTKDTKELLAEAGDELVQLPIWAEPFDKIGFKIIIDLVDKHGDRVIPDEFDNVLNAGIQLALNGDYEEAAALIAEAIDDKLDIPYIDDDTEALLFVDGARFLVRLIQHWIESKKS